MDDELLSKDFLVAKSSPTASELYEEQCFLFMSPPIAAVLAAFNGKTETLDLENYCPHPINLYVTEKGLKGEGVPIINTLNFANNPVSEETFISISRLLEQNQSLSSLDLSRCNMTIPCLQLLINSLPTCISLKSLNLFNCALGDVGGSLLLHALIENETISEINLGHNDLHVLCANELRLVLLQNANLEVMNLAWNSLYPDKDAAAKVARGLQRNKTLRELDLSWNGLTGKMFVKYLRLALRRHPKLVDLSLENNVLSPAEIGEVLAGVQNAKVLECLRMGGNSWTDELRRQAIAVAVGHKAIQVMSFGKHQMLSDAVAKFAIDSMAKKPYLQVVFMPKKPPRPQPPVDFVAIVVDRCKFLAMKPKKKKLKRDMGHFMQKLREEEVDLVTREKFLELLAAFKAKLDEELVAHLAEGFTQKVQVGKRKRKRVFIKEMAEYYLSRHPTEPPPPVVAVPAKKKKGKSAKRT